MSKRIVVDADVFAAASLVSERGKKCALVLTTILEVCHRVAVSDDLMTEWQAHRSAFSNKWLNQMFGRKKVERVQRTSMEPLRDQINALSEPCRSVGTKDAHLVEAAISTDGVVVSCDETARACLAKVGDPRFSGVSWLNPDVHEDAATWLEGGAIPEARLLLTRP